MTTGQRIAAKRKELGLSQEALGERLGVSRQSIYKWESDTSLPDIDKLVAMSRMFSVPVGWLLGVEEDRPEQAADEGLSEQQLRLVEEILSRYQQEQQSQTPPPPPTKPQPRWKRWAICLVALGLLLGINGRVNRLRDQYQNQYNALSNSVNNLSATMSGQLNSVTQQVEDILRAQNALTADYGTEIVSGDLKANTVTFSLRAVPKTYQPGMTAEFQADSGQGVVTAAGTLGDGQEFSAQLTCALTDHITLTVVFHTGDTSQTQLLDTYPGLYTGTLPEVDLVEYGLLMSGTADKDGKHITVPAGDLNLVSSSTAAAENAVLGSASVAKIQVGLFRNHRLVSWLPQRTRSDGSVFFPQEETTLDVSEGDQFAYAALVTDDAGRQFVCPSMPYYTADRDGNLSWCTDDIIYNSWEDPADWGL